MRRELVHVGQRVDLKQDYVLDSLLGAQGPNHPAVRVLGNGVVHGITVVLCGGIQ